MALGEKGKVEYGVNVEGGAFSLDPADRLGTSFEGCFSIYLLLLLHFCFGKD